VVSILRPRHGSTFVSTARGDGCTEVAAGEGDGIGGLGGLCDLRVEWEVTGVWVPEEAGEASHVQVWMCGCVVYALERSLLVWMCVCML